MKKNLLIQLIIVLSLAASTFAQVPNPVWTSEPNLNANAVVYGASGNIYAAGGRGIFVLNQNNGLVLSIIPATGVINTRSLSVNVEETLAAVGIGEIVQVYDLRSKALLATLNPGVGFVRTTAIIHGDLVAAAGDPAPGVAVFDTLNQSAPSRMLVPSPPLSSPIFQIRRYDAQFGWLHFMGTGAGAQPRLFFYTASTGAAGLSYPIGVIGQVGRVSNVLGTTQAIGGTNVLSGSSRAELVIGAHSVNLTQEVQDVGSSAAGAFLILTSAQLQVRNETLTSPQILASGGETLSVSPSVQTRFAFNGNGVVRRATLASPPTSAPPTIDWETSPTGSLSSAMVAVSPNGAYVGVSGRTSGRISVFSAVSGALLWGTDLPLTVPWGRAATFSPDSSRLCVLNWPIGVSRLYFYDSVDGGNVSSFSVGADTDLFGGVWIDNSRIAVALAAPGAIRIYQTDGTVWSETSVGGPATAMAINPAGTKLAVAGIGSGIKILGIAPTTMPIEQSITFEANPTQIAWSPDGALYVGGQASLLLFDSANLALAPVTVVASLPAFISGVVVAQDPAYVYATASSVLYRIHVPTQRIVASMPLWSLGVSLAVHPVHNLFYVGLGNGDVGAFDRVFSNLGDTIFWEGPNTGPLPRLMVGWQIQNGAVALPSVVIDIAPADWQVRAVGNVDGLASSDLVWQNTNPGFSIPGLIAYWSVQPSGAPLPIGTGGAPPSFDWQVRSFTDFNGDGIADILWLNVATGAIGIWTRDSSGSVTGTFSVGIRPAGWRLVGATDSFGKGTAEIYFQNTTTSQVSYWRLNNSFAPVATVAVGTPGINWQFEGVGMFKNYGPGLLFRDTSSNQMAFWNISSDGNVTETGVIGSSPTGWKVIGIGNL
ncbi:MAG: YncE family protein [Fimbriimonadaceae bacterium]